MARKLEGIVPAMVTPFTKNGKHVDYDKACALAVHFADQGVHGLFPCGTTGSGLLMSVEERKKLLEELIGAVGRRINVIAQTGAMDTATAIDLARHAKDAGADAAGLLAPMVFFYDRAAIMAHYKAVAKAVHPFRILVYNFPAIANNAVTPGMVLELSQSVPNIVGLKDSSGEMAAFTYLATHMPKGFSLFNGADPCTVLAYTAGAHGSVSSAANVVPKLFIQIRNAVKKGQPKKALDAQRKLTDVASLARGPALVQEALRLQGLDAGHVRPPMRQLTQKEKRTLAKGMETLGLL